MATVKNISEKSPLTYKLVRNAEWLNPLKISEDSSVCLDQLSKYLQVLCDAGRIKQDKGNKQITEHRVLCMAKV